ncbi:MAG: zinc-ribbon domain-containing protein [Lachnospiraceae bacterium]|nr:zinc-ribbon domain-containing protein [Lachnospiraceae bacterium]
MVKLKKGENDFVTKCKQNGKEFLIDEWDYEKNILKPDEVLYASDKLIYWKCKFGHQWARRIHTRTDSKGLCPYCEGILPIIGENDLKTVFPEIAIEWDYEKNEKGPEDYLPRSGYKAYWVCKNGHRWRAQIASRTGPAKNGCRICSGKRPDIGKNDFKIVFPKIAEEWDYELNKDGPENHLPYSSFKAYWKCSKGHPSWKTSIAKRTKRGDGCPYCSGRLPVAGETDLKTIHPELINEWDSERNREDMEKYTPYCRKKVYWKCNKGHSYIMNISDRTRNDKKLGCPYCSGKKPIKGETDLKTLREELCEEWSEKNNTSPDEYTLYSNEKVWWICNKCGHEWRAFINNRARGWGCPNCAKNNRKRL